MVSHSRQRDGVLKDSGSPEHGDDERRFHVGAPAEPVSEEPHGLLPANLFKNKNRILEKTMSSEANTDVRFCGEASDRTKTLWMSHVTETNYSITELKTCFHFAQMQIISQTPNVDIVLTLVDLVLFVSKTQDQLIQSQLRQVMWLFPVAQRRGGIGDTDGLCMLWAW